jgi:uncharacterized protein
MAFFAVTTAKGARWEPTRGIREQDAWDQHAAFFDRLVEQGVVILGGPIASSSEEDVALLAVEAADERALRTLFSTDPWAVNQVLRIKDVRSWSLWLDGRQR